MDPKEIIIHKSKNYLEKLEKKGIDIHLSSFAYLVSWAPCSGYSKLCHLIKSNFFNWKWIFVLNDIIKISNLNNYEIICTNAKSDDSQSDRLIVTWGKYSDFNSDGTFNDRYFKTNSDQFKNSIWLISYLDDREPDKVASNIKIIKKNKNAAKISLIFFFKVLIGNFFKYGFTLKFFHYTSWISTYAVIFQKLFEKEFGKKNIKYVVMPYEAQPFQTNLIKYLKRKDEKIKVTGYIHSCPPPLPTHLIFKKYSPDLLILNGEDQYNCFNKQLGWTKEKLKLLPSLRFNRNSKNNMSNKIFLPQGISGEKKILNELIYLLNKSEYKYLSLFKIQRHPTKMDSKRHLKLEKKIKKILISKTKPISHESITNKISLFIGASSSPIEALERGINVLHICVDPNTDLFSEKIFPNLRIKKLTSNTFLYELRKKGSLIIFGEEEITLKNYFL